MAAKKKGKASTSKKSPTVSPVLYKRSLSMQKTMYLVIVLLFLVSLVLAFKHAKLKYNWMQYAGKSQQQILESDAKNTEEEAKVIVHSLTTQVSGKPLYKSTDLQNYVMNLSKQLNRDVVVLDTNKKILADTVPGNVGKTFVEDSEGQVAETLKDGMTRGFVETSSDYPKGLNQVVVALKETGGKIVGAVVLSSDMIQK
jgi:hypothetical protein